MNLDTLLFTSKFLKQREYWLSLLSGKAGLPETTFHFPGGTPGQGESGREREEVELRFPGELNALLLKSSKGNDISLYLLLLTALKTLIYRYTGKEDIIVISPLLEQKMAKDTVNDRVFICSEITPGITFKELLFNTRKAVLGAYGNQDYPLDKIIAFLSGEEFPGGGLSHIACSLENIHHPGAVDLPGNGLVFTFKRVENKITGLFSYNPAVCGSFYARQAARQFVQLLQRALDDIHGGVSCLPFLSKEDKKQLLEDFNNKRVDLPANKTVACLFTEEAAKNPYKSAIVYEDQVLTYETVNNRAGRLAWVLRQKGLTNDSLAAVLMERSPQMVEAILAAWKAGGAYLPISTDYPRERIDYIMSDSRAKVLITPGTFLSLPFSPSKPTSSSLAYVIYTSGSTGRPKGVMVEQAGMLNHIMAKIDELEIAGNSMVAQNASHTFDISVWQFFAALAVGGTTVIYSNRLVLQPERFIDRITADKIDLLEVVPSYLLLLLDAFKGEFKYLRYLLVTGETVPHTLVKRWFSRYAIPMVNAYGPTEASDDITHHVMVKAPVNQSVPIGSPLQNLTIYIVDKYMQLCPVGVRGEILVAGIGVGRGYLNNPTRTGEVFIANPFNKTKVLWGPGAVFQKSPWPPEAYKTGDSGCWTENGAIEFFGRLDQQVKIRGFRIEPGEIEQRLLSHSAVKDAVVTAKEFPGKDSGSELVAYIVWCNGGEAKTSKDKLELQDYLSESLPLHMVPLYFVGLDKLPLTANGKVDKKSLPGPEGSELNRGDYAAPGDRLEEKLVEIWQNVLERKKIGINDSFFDLGGHSLNATRVVSGIYKALSVEIGLRDIFTFPTIAGIAGIIRKKTKSEFAEIQPVEEREYYDVSHAQRRLWVLHQFEEAKSSYNLPDALIFKGRLNVDALNKAFRALIRRHESLRTGFTTVNGVPVQVINKRTDFTLEEIFVPGESAKEIVLQFARGVFDLTAVPLFKAALLKFSQDRGHDRDRCIFLFNMHHIISDGWSMNIFVRELLILYSAFGKGSLPVSDSLPVPPRIHYKDYAHWQNLRLSGAAGGQTREYWHKKFPPAEETPVLDFPCDYPRPPVKTYNGNTLSYALGKELSAGINALCKEQGVTLFMTLLTAVKVFIHRYTGQEDIIVGCPTAGRDHPDLEDQVGFYINTLALRDIVRGDESFETLLRRVKQTAAGAFENQNYPFDKLVDELDLRKDTGRHPLFDIMVVLQNNERGRLKAADIDITPFSGGSGTGTSKFDLTFGFLEVSEGIHGYMEYNTDIFKAERIRRVSVHVTELVKRIVRAPRRAVKHITILTDEEKHRLLVQFNDTTGDYPRNRTVADLFADRAARVGDRVAVIGAEQSAARSASVSYKELNKKSTRLAYLLKEKGVQSNGIVGIIAERSIETIVGIFGIVKAGAAYLPIDPGYPRERIDYILADSGASVPVTTGTWTEKDRTVIKGDGQIKIKPRPDVPHPAPRALGPAYVIYTSGTTGSPKGVMIEHTSLVNLIYSSYRSYDRDFGPSDYCLSLTNFCFDVSVCEIFVPLLFGAGVVLLSRDRLFEPGQLAKTILEKSITFAYIPPGLLREVYEHLKLYEGRLRLNKLMAGVESIKDYILENYLKLNPSMKIINGYGPTEATIYVASYTYCSHEPEDRRVPIGRPIANMKIFILDRYGWPVPVGVPGELCISGIGLARGYLNKPELTAGKFLTAKTPPINHSPLTPHPSPVYKTGDLAEWLPDGNILFIGRIDRQVKIRGFRIELGGIESLLLKHEVVRAAVVLAKQGGYLIAYIVAGKKLPGSVLRKYLSRHLPDYMIPSYFMQIDRIPLTPNGKVDQKALPEPEVMQGEEYTAPANQIEKKLADIWSEVLLIKREGISVNANFFQLGGHSLNAVVISARVHKELQVKLPLAQIFKALTIRGLTNYIKRSGKIVYSAVGPVEKRDYYPMSSAQKRLFLMDRFENIGTGYNMSSVFQVSGELDKGRLKNACRQLIRRHESFRTSFHLMAEEPVQRVHKEAAFDLDSQDSHDLDNFLKRFIRPFDLAKAPLLRVGWAKLRGGEREHLLLFDMHHIVGDGASMEVLADDFTRFYESESESEPGPGSETEAAAPLRIQYKDFALWQKGLFASSKIKAQEDYWLGLYPGGEDIPLLNLPTDFPRPALFSFAGDSYGFRLNPGLTAGIKGLGTGSGATLFMTLLATFNILLYKYSGQDDIVVGSPVLGRSHWDLHPIVGMFVNSLALRSYPVAGKTCLEFLNEVKENALKAFENQDLQFEDLVDRLNPRRDPSRSPIFDVSLVVQNFQQGAKEMKSLKMAPYPWENRTAKFDITLFVMETADEIYFSLEYCSALFKKETIKRLAARFLMVIRQMIEAPGIKINEVDILTDEEKQQLLSGFNDTTIAYPENRTMADLFEEQARKGPDRIALATAHELRELHELHERKNVFLTYGELNKRSQQLTHCLRERGVLADHIVGITMKRSIAMIIGIIGILKAGAAYLPIDPDYPEERKRYMLADSNAGVIVGADGDRSIKSPLERGAPKGRGVSLAYIIYTSGSTGQPKGVAVGHRSLVNLCFWTLRYYRVTGKDRAGQYAEISFDASAAEIFPYLVKGASIHIIDNETRLDMQKLNRFFETQGITIAFLPTRVCQQFMEEVDNRSLHILLAAGDKLQRFVKRNYTLYNNYGPTENTVASTAYAVNRFEDNIPIGKPIDNNRIYILDGSHSHLQPIGVPGELCIAGTSLASGYLNNPELTAEKFCLRRAGGLFLKKRDENPPCTPHKNFYLTKQKFCGGAGGGFSKEPPARRRQIYRTGDLGRWLVDGNIEFLGRIDHQVKVRGFRIEIGEIEARLREYGAVKEAAVIARNDESGDKYLTAYIVPYIPGLNPTDLRTYLGGKLPGYMIPAYFIEVEKIPLTVNGKVNRNVLAEMQISDIGARDEHILPGDDLEEQLVIIWSEVLHIDKSKISVGANFFELGGHSLKAAVLTAKIHRRLNVKLPLAEVFKSKTIREMAGYLRNAGQDKFVHLQPVEKKEYYELSPAQQRLYLTWQMDRESTLYNVPMFIDTGTGPGPGPGENIRPLESAFRQLIARHESLRTSFHMKDEQSVQRVHDEVEFKMEYYSAGRKEEHLAHFVRPFDLTGAPLLRAGVLKQAAQRYILMVDIHHIISDKTSQDILSGEFMGLCAGEELAPLKIHYKDFSRWQNSRGQRAAVKKQEEYWLKTFSGELPLLRLPTDYPRPSPQSFDGDTVTFRLEKEETRPLKKLAAATGTTLYMVLLAVFDVFLSRLGGQEDITVGTPAGGRKHSDLDKIIGIFVSTLALRNFPAGQDTFKNFLARVKKRTLQAFENQDYPYETLIETLALERHAGRNPLFDAMLAYQDMEVPDIDMFTSTGFDNKNVTQTSKFDLTLQVYTAEENILLRFEFRTRLFKHSTIRRFTRYFKKLVSGVTAKPSAKLREIEIIPPDEKKQLLHDFNDTTVEYALHKTIQQLFAEQAAKTPDNIAVVLHRGDVTYRELNKKSDRVAGLLKARGVLPGHIVGIMMKRSMEMIIGILGILKAGAAYLPIDPDTPEERKQYMMADSGAGILLATGDTENTGRKFPSPLTPHPSPPTSLAYVIYTSGTTGRPKGTLVEHHNVTRLTGNTNYIALTGRDRVLQLSNYAFDGSVFDIFAALLNGAVLVMIHREDVLSAHRLSELLKREAITVFFVTTALFNTLLDIEIDCFAGTRKVLFGGERVSVEHARKALQYLGKDKIIHVYGPTETTVFATYYNINRIDGIPATIPIGRPLSNTIVYILDSNSQPVPLGVFGEIYIGGTGTARGYLNNPELTADSFCLRRAGGSFEKPPPAPPQNFCLINQKFLWGVQGGGFFKKSPPGRRRHYKTGDLARWLPDGNIEFLGRIDSQVKIRGFRIEVGEIETLLRGHDAVKEVVVIVHNDDTGDKYLSAYIVPYGPGLSPPGLRRYLSGKLPGYMMPAYFIEVENIPLTANGKVDTNALAEFQVSSFKSRKESTAPRDEIEKTLVQIWWEVLGKDGHAPVGIDDNFFERGGHSLKGTILTAKIHHRLKVEVPLAEIFNTPTIRGLAAYIRKIGPAKLTPLMPLEAVEKKEYYRLSYNQERLWTIQRLEPESPAYNMPAMVVIRHTVETETIKKVLRMLIRRHAGFRTYFGVMANEPVQFVKETAAIEDDDLLKVVDISSFDGREQEKRGEQVHAGVWEPPFDLAKAPLFRSVLLKTGREENHFIFNMHHIISDGWSMEILKREFSLLYGAFSAGKGKGPEIQLPPLECRYVDFVRRQRKLLTDPAYREESHLFWRKKMEAGFPRLRLPVDYPGNRNIETGRESGGYRFVINTPVTRALIQLAQDNYTGIYVVIFSVLNLLLSRLCGEKDIVTGLVGAGREHVKLQDIVGCFVNTLVMRTRLDYGCTFTRFLGQVNRRVMEMVQHQDYPLELVLEELKMRFPDISLQFNMFNMNETMLNRSVDSFEPRHLEKLQVAKFDMSVTATQLSNGIDIQCRCRKGLFKKETIEFMMGQFDRLFREIAENPHRQLKEYLFKKKKKRVTF